MNLTSDITCFLSKDVTEISNELKTIDAKLQLIKDTDNQQTYIIKFSDNSQLNLKYSFQSFLKGLIFRKYNNTLVSSNADADTNANTDASPSLP